MTVSQPLAKRLKSKGFPQKEANYYWLFQTDCSWKTTQLRLYGEHAEWLRLRGEVTPEAEKRMGVGIGIYYRLMKDRIAESGLSEAQYYALLKECYAAPTVEELGKALPGNLDEFVRENFADLDSDLYLEWCNNEHPYYDVELLAKVWLLLKRQDAV